MNPSEQQIKQLLALIDMGLTEIRLSDGKRTVVFAPDNLNEDYWSIHVKDGLEIGRKRTDLDLFGFKFNEIVPILKNNL